MVGDNGTIADLEVATFLGWCMARDPAAETVLKNLPKLQQIPQMVKNHPKLVAAENRRRALARSKSRQ